MSNEVSVNNKVQSLQKLLEVSRKQIEMAMPKHLTADRMMRIAVTEIRKNPTLAECTQASFLGAIIQASQLGLEPGGALGHCYLIPFNSKERGMEVQFIVGYRGLLELAYRSPKVKKVIARAVYEKDKFSYDFGIDEKLVHVPNQSGEGKDLTHVYCIVELDGGVKLFDVMTAPEIEAARGRSKSSEKGPWKSDYEAMAKKSVVRRFFKFMPSSIEMQGAIGMDEAADRGEQHNGAVIEAVGVRVEDKPATTDRFKEQLGANAEISKQSSGKQQVIIPKSEPAPAFSDDDPGAFNDFNQMHVTTKIHSQKAHADLILEVVDAAKLAGLKDMKSLSARCMRDFQKITGDMTPEELEVLLITLEKEKK